jgi:hypothetical protein
MKTSLRNCKSLSNYLLFNSNWKLSPLILCKVITLFNGSVECCRANATHVACYTSAIIRVRPALLELPLWSSGQSFWLKNAHVLCFLWGTNWIYVCYVEGSRPPLWSSGQSSWLHNGNVLWFLRGTNWIYICYVEESRPPLWSSGHSSWLHNGDVLWFLWGTNWIHICYVEESRPPLWSRDRSSWLHNGDVLCFLWGTNWIYMLCRRK